jgi:hypothetical protein
MAAALPTLVAPLALDVARAVARTPTPSPAFNGILAKAAAAHFSFGALLAAGILLDSS